MKRLFLSFFLISGLYLFVYINSIQAQSIPLLQCGDAYSILLKGYKLWRTDKCCNLPPICPTGILGILDKLKIIPGINSYITQLEEKCQEFEDLRNKFVPNFKCFFGTPTVNNLGECICEDIKAAEARIPEMRSLCLKYLRNKSQQNELEECLQCMSHGFWTGIGCIPLNLGSLVKYLLTFGIGLGGGIALLCIIYSAFILQTSGGNPEKIKKAQELLTSCIMGLMLIIFSVFILRLIGVDILQIPGFGK